jgi:hypothetical protein
MASISIGSKRSIPFALIVSALFILTFLLFAFFVVYALNSYDSYKTNVYEKTLAKMNRLNPTIINVNLRAENSILWTKKVFN